MKKDRIEISLKTIIKMRSLLFLFICCSQILHAQNQVSIYFTDKNKLSVPYVTVYSEQKQIYAMSDVYGKWEISVNSSDSILLNIEIIGFENTSLLLYNINRDTTIELTLQEDIQYLEDVTVVAEKPDVRKMKVKSAGYFKGSHAGDVVFRSKTKLGVYIPMEKTATKKLLKTINFQISNSKNLRNKKDIAVEIKIYAVKNSKLSDKPLNTKPIYIPFSEIGKKNSIDIDQIIFIHNHDVFVSLEFPEYEANHSEDYIYVRKTRSKKNRNNNFSYISGSKSPYWDNFNINNTTGKFIKAPEPKYQELIFRDDYSIGITYYEER